MIFKKQLIKIIRPLLRRKRFLEDRRRGKINKKNTVVYIDKFLNAIDVKPRINYLEIGSRHNFDLPGLKKLDKEQILKKYTVDPDTNINNSFNVALSNKDGSQDLPSM